MRVVPGGTKLCAFEHVLSSFPRRNGTLCIVLGIESLRDQLRDDHTCNARYSVVLNRVKLPGRDVNSGLQNHRLSIA